MEIDLRKNDILNETNPFMIQLKGKMYLQPRANTIVARGQEIIDTTTGEVLQDDVLFGSKKIVDKSHFAKIYASEVSMLFDLSKTAMNVFLYISKVMDYDNKAYVNSEKPSKIGYKTSTSVRAGLKELIKKDIIAPAFAPGWYWVNPTIVCKGERFAKFTVFVTEERAQKDEARAKKKLAHSELSEQGKDFFDLMNEATDGKIETMNEAEEEKEREKYERERKTRSLFPELESKNPFNEDNQ